jgi:endonuclease/exonuclease/phosphatase (EEP) superfamily protein YafD
VWLARAIVTFVLALALFGHAARDRFAAFAGLSYLPLLPVALAAVALATLPGGRARIRAWLAAAGVFSALWSLPSLVGWQDGELRVEPGSSVVRLLQWNVLWGGPRRAGSWAAISDSIANEAPDIVVLSEAPRERALSRLQARLGPSWSTVSVAGRPHRNYVYNLVLMSRWPARLVQDRQVDRGETMLVVVDTPERPLRVLVVDGESSPARDRSAMLADVAAIVAAQAQAGTPIDVLAGDFNAPSRSSGFDLLWQQGYRLAALASGGWRATWPMFLPLIDVDHVLLRNTLAFDCSFFSSRSSDHRGQLVRFRIDDSTTSAGLARR